MSLELHHTLEVAARALAGYDRPVSTPALDGDRAQSDREVSCGEAGTGGDLASSTTGRCELGRPEQEATSASGQQASSRGRERRQATASTLVQQAHG